MVFLAEMLDADTETVNYFCTAVIYISEIIVGKLEIIVLGV